MGRYRVLFNAHRVLSPAAVLAAIKPLRLVRFAAVNDRGELVAEANPAASRLRTSPAVCFELTKD